MSTLINIRHFRAYIAVCEHRHFTRAAEAINLTQPALSALVRQLEEELDVRLIDRRTRSVELTRIGEEFYEISRKLIGSYEDALAHMEDYSALAKGQVTLAVLPSIAASILPDILSDFKARHDKISVNVLDIPGDDILASIRAKRADIALTHAAPHEDFVVQPVIRDRLVLVGEPLRAKVRNGAVRWKDLNREPIIAMARGTTIRTLTDMAALQAKVELEMVLEPRLLTTAIGFARQGYGCAILPSIHFPAKIQTDIPVADLTAPEVVRDISVLYLKHVSLSPAAAALLEFITAAIKQD